MSISLAKKSLELATDSTENPGIHFKGFKKSVPKRRKLKERRLPDEKKNALSLVQKIRRKTLVDREINKVEQNVEKLLNLSRSNTVNKRLEDKILEKIGTAKEVRDKVDEQKTGFSEKDFADFEKEYFGNQ